MDQRRSTRQARYDRREMDIYDINRKANARRHRRRRRRQLLIFYMFLILSIFCVGIFFIVNSFFKVAEIEITGSKKYNYDQIKRVSSLEIGQNIFKYKSSAISEVLKTKLIYIDDAIVKKMLPNKISISVVDVKPKYILKKEKSYVLLSSSMKVLGIKSGKIGDEVILKKKLVELKGFDITEKDIGRFIPKDNEKLILLERINQAIEKNKFLGVVKIDLTNKSNIILRYLDRITILLGDIRQASYKIRFAKRIIDKSLDINEIGTIDATDVLSNSKVYFMPQPQELVTSEGEYYGYYIGDEKIE